MADAVSNPHDFFFRRMMTLPNAAVDIARQTLPQDVLAQLDLSCVEQEETSWVDPDLKAHFADALYKIKFKEQTSEDAYLCILLEHKSSPDHLVAFQVLRYMVQVWQHHLVERKPPFPPIIPLVLYHGREKWTVPREFEVLFTRRPGLQNYIPNFEYVLLDISAKTDGNVQAVVDPFIRASLRVMWLIFRGDLLNQLPGVLKDLPPDGRGVLELLETICRYVLSGGKDMQSESGTGR